MKVIIEITKAEGDLIMANYPYQLYASNIKSNGKYDLEILDVDKFIEFLNDEIDNCFPVNENGMSQMVSAPNGVFYEGSESQKQDNLFSILSILGNWRSSNFNCPTYWVSHKQFLECSGNIGANTVAK